jgi:hypothetical protein
MQELRTVKNDNQKMKVDMTRQIVTTGSYELPQNMNVTSYTKMIIDSLMTFLND